MAALETPQPQTPPIPPLSGGETEPSAQVRRSSPTTLPFSGGHDSKHVAPLAASSSPPDKGGAGGVGAAEIGSPDHPDASLSWHAQLHLGFERRPEGTRLAKVHHHGPLRVQKALYPEGPELCQVLVLHPPSGIAGGDHLRIEAGVAESAQAQLTTPGAGKWYRSAGLQAAQELDFQVGPNASLEWLPQETIVFDGALSRMDSRIRLAAGARYLGWEVLCLGRRASGERFSQGEIRLATRIEQEGRLLWLERGHVEGGGRLMASRPGFGSHPVCATLLAVGAPVPPETLAACRAITPQEDGACLGLSQLPGVLVGRYLGDSSEAARHWLTAVWTVLRPVFLGREAVPPRIWAT